MRAKYIGIASNALVSLFYALLYFVLTKNTDITLAIFIVLFQLHTAIAYAVSKIKGK